MKQARTAGRRSLLALGVLLPALGGAGCAAMGEVMEEALELNPEKTLTQALLRTPAQWERSLRQARQVHAQVQREYGARLVEQSYLQERLQQIAEKLVAVSHFKGLPVKVYLLEDDTLNAFNTGGATSTSTPASSTRRAPRTSWPSSSGTSSGTRWGTTWTGRPSRP